jgi:nitrogenase-associated protein
MAKVIFYEKPGCAGNARQRRILEDAGHTVEARSLVDTPWTNEALLSFFGSLPVAQWFNLNSLPVKSGDVVPERLDREAALALLKAQPLLIRRPLLEVDGERRVGFEAESIAAWIGLGPAAVNDDLEACRHAAGHSCQAAAQGPGAPPADDPQS